VYGESSYNGYPYRHPFVTLHDVIHQEDEVRLGAAQLLTPDVLCALVADLGQSLPVEILPECTLARTADMVVWWSPASIRTMFFSDRGGDKALRGLSGKQYPHPPLLFKASGSNLGYGRWRKTDALKPKPRYAWRPTGTATTTPSSVREP